ncbi:MAG: MATE family efflux transporter [Verrucomicrobiota bacterium]
MPLVIVQYSLILKQFADTLIVSRLGGEALAAIGPASLMTSLLMAFGLGIMGGLTTVVGQAHGGGDLEQTGKATWQGIWLGLGLGLLMLSFGPSDRMVFGEFFNHSAAVYAMEVEYFRWSLFGLAPEFVADAIAVFFIATGRPVVPMIVAGIGVALNPVLSAALVFGWLGLAELGIRGAAIGSACSAVIQVVILLAIFLGRDYRRGYGTGKPAIRLENWKRLFKIGIPAGLQEAVDLASWGILLIWLIGRFGDAHLAAATVLFRCMQLSFLPADGIGISLSAQVANDVGSRRFRVARARVRIVTAIAAGYMAMVGVLMVLFRGPIFALFTGNDQIMAIGVAAILFVAAFQVFDAINIVYVNALQGVGDTFWPLIVNGFLTILILLGGGLFVVHQFPQWESVGVWGVATLYILFQAVAFRWRWRSGRWAVLVPDQPT